MQSGLHGLQGRARPADRGEEERVDGALRQGALVEVTEPVPMPEGVGLGDKEGVVVRRGAEGVEAQVGGEHQLEGDEQGKDPEFESRPPWHLAPEHGPEREEQPGGQAGPHQGGAPTAVEAGHDPDAKNFAGLVEVVGQVEPHDLGIGELPADPVAPGGGLGPAEHDVAVVVEDTLEVGRVLVDVEVRAVIAGRGAGKLDDHFLDGHAGGGQLDPAVGIVTGAGEQAPGGVPAEGVGRGEAHGGARDLGGRLFQPEQREESGQQQKPAGEAEDFFHRRRRNRTTLLNNPPSAIWGIETRPPGSVRASFRHGMSRVSSTGLPGSEAMRNYVKNRAARRHRSGWVGRSRQRSSKPLR